jgi:similar to stage IV sporulation protein
MCNLVAKISGKIVRCEVLEGQVKVQREEYVPKGALLISGVVERKNGSFTTVCAKGRVIAETERVFEVVIPWEQKETVYTGEEKRIFHLGVLGRSIPWGSQSIPKEDNWIKLSREEPISVLGRKLPILLQEDSYWKTEEKRNG